MKIGKLNLQELRNTEHFDFHTEFKALVSKYEPENIGIKQAFETFEFLYAKIEECSKVGKDCASSQQLAMADEARDEIFRGLFDTIISANSHFNPQKKIAAQRLGTIMFQYFSAERKAYNEETISISKMIIELFSTFNNDLICLGIIDWVEELSARNHTFDILMRSRYNEDIAKNELKTKQIRTKIDEAYRNITYRIDALIIINGSTKQAPFLKELNTIIDTYNSILTKRKGVATKNIEKLILQGQMN